MSNEPRNVLAIIEFSADSFDARARNTGRLMTVEIVASGKIRVLIEAENPMSNNLGFVTLSDETMDSNVFNSAVRPLIAGMQNVQFRYGYL
jgi:hypothetical protein